MLRKHNIKRLGVVYKNKLVGIISSSDVIAVTPELVDVVSEKAAIIRGELGIQGRLARSLDTATSAASGRTCCSTTKARLAAKCAGASQLPQKQNEVKFLADSMLGKRGAQAPHIWI